MVRLNLQQPPEGTRSQNNASVDQGVLCISYRVRKGTRFWYKGPLVKALDVKLGKLMLLHPGRVSCPNVRYGNLGTTLPGIPIALGCRKFCLMVSVPNSLKILLSLCAGGLSNVWWV